MTARELDDNETAELKVTFSTTCNYSRQLLLHSQQDVTYWWTACTCIDIQIAVQASLIIASSGKQFTNTDSEAMTMVTNNRHL